MKLQQYLLNHYLHIPFEDFSHKAVAALGILTTIEHNTMAEIKKEDQEKLAQAIKDVKKIIDITNDKTQISLFVLDRNISPQDFSRNPVSFETNFTLKKKVNDRSNVKLSSDKIQEKLCIAIMEINQILMQQIAGFSEQMSFNDSDL